MKVRTVRGRFFCFRGGPTFEDVLMKIRSLGALVLSGCLLVSAATLGAQDAAQGSKESGSITLSVGELDEYVGQYRDAEEPDAVSSVYREGDRLYVEGERWARVELLAESKDHFLAHG